MMKESLFVLLLASAFLFSACDTQNDNAGYSTKGAFPSLQVKTANIFEKSEQVKFEINDHEDYPNYDEPMEAELNYFFNTVETGVQWLDNLLIKEILVTLNQDKDFAHKTDLDLIRKGEEKTVLLNSIQKSYDAELYKLKEGGHLGVVYSIETTYIGQRQNIISFSQNRNVYVGGPHGTYSTRYLNFDSNKKALLYMDDVIPRDKQKMLKDLLWENYKNRIANGDGESFVSKENFTISPEFYFSPDGMNFVYAPSVLAPFSKGETTLQLYWSDIEKLIDPQYSWAN